MNKIDMQGKKVRIITDYLPYIGQIGIIKPNNYDFEYAWTIQMEDGKCLTPYSPNATLPQCELLEEYDIKDIAGKNHIIYCPTLDIWKNVISICMNSKLFPGETDSLEKWMDRYDVHEEACINVSKKYYPASLSFGSKELYKREGYNIIKGEDFVIHNEQLLTKQQEKVKEMKQPEIFAIFGKVHQLIAIKQDLKEIGYTFSAKGANYEKPEVVGNNFSNISTLKNYLELTALPDVGIWEKNKRFNLPEDYSKALEYAKEAINSEYWNIPQSKKITIGSKNAEIEIFKDKILAENGKGKINIELLRKRYQSLLIVSGGTNDIGDYGMFISGDVRFIRIGCTSENNLVSMQEIKKVLDIVDELNK